MVNLTLVFAEDGWLLKALRKEYARGPHRWLATAEIEEEF
jgi:hypothetical protein